jgi:integrase
MLRRHRARQTQERLSAGTDWQNSGGLVFTTPHGRPIEPRHVQAEFKATLAAAHLPDMRLHDLRHAAATFPIAQGLPLRLVMEVLGHSTIALTANTYGHIERGMMADAATRMDALLTSEKSQQIGPMVVKSCGQTGTVVFRSICETCPWSKPRPGVIDG